MSSIRPFGNARDVYAIDDEHIPIAGTGLFDDRQSGAGALVFLEIYLDAILFFKRFYQCRVCPLLFALPKPRTDESTSVRK